LASLFSIIEAVDSISFNLLCPFKSTTSTVNVNTGKDSKYNVSVCPSPTINMVLFGSFISILYKDAPAFLSQGFFSFDVCFFDGFSFFRHLLQNSLIY